MRSVTELLSVERKDARHGYDRVLRRVARGRPDECWKFPVTGKNGYGRLGFRGEHIYAHRVVAEYVFGADAIRGKFVCHHCDVPSCVNPLHLFVGDAKVNVHDAMRKGRRAVSPCNLSFRR